MGYQVILVFRDYFEILNYFSTVLKVAQESIGERVTDVIQDKSGQSTQFIQYLLEQLEVVEKEMEEMEKNGTIELSVSEWSSPIVVVRK